MDPQQIQDIIAEQVALEVQKNLPGPQPKQVKIYHKVTGEPPPTPSGLVYRVDAPEWCAPRQVIDKETGKFHEVPSEYVRTRAEVMPAEPEEPEASSRAFPGSESDVPPDEPPEEIEVLRTRYEKTTGKRPHHKLGRAKLKAGIAAAG